METCQVVWQIADIVFLAFLARLITFQPQKFSKIIILTVKIATKFKVCGAICGNERYGLPIWLKSEGTQFKKPR